jgi:hypothetical protein
MARLLSSKMPRAGAEGPSVVRFVQVSTNVVKYRQDEPHGY